MKNFFREVSKSPETSAEKVNFYTVAIEIKDRKGIIQVKESTVAPVHLIISELLLKIRDKNGFDSRETRFPGKRYKNAYWKRKKVGRM
jgi:hypothetical protein